MHAREILNALMEFINRDSSTDEEIRSAIEVVNQYQQSLDSLKKMERQTLHKLNAQSEFEEHKQLLDIQDYKNNNPLHIALKKKPHCVGLLLEAKVALDLKDYYGNTPLHIAIEQKNEVAIKQLLEHGAKVDTPNREGKTPLMLAIINGNKKAIDILLDAKADINFNHLEGTTPLMLAVKNGNKDTIDKLIEAKADINFKISKGISAFLVACSSQQLPIVKSLLERKADINAVDDRKKSGLDYAITKKDAAIVLTLLNFTDPKINILLSCHNFLRFLKHCPAEIPEARQLKKWCQFFEEEYIGLWNRLSDMPNEKFFYTCGKILLTEDDETLEKSSPGDEKHTVELGEWRPNLKRRCAEDALERMFVQAKKQEHPFTQLIEWYLTIAKNTEGKIIEEEKLDQFLLDELETSSLSDELKNFAKEGIPQATKDLEKEKTKPSKASKAGESEVLIELLSVEPRKLREKEKSRVGGLTRSPASVFNFTNLPKKTLPGQERKTPGKP